VQQAGHGQEKDDVQRADGALQERGLWGSTNILLAGKQENKLLCEEGKGRERSGRWLLKRISVTRMASLHIPSPARRHSTFHPPAFQSTSRVQAQLVNAVTSSPSGVAQYLGIVHEYFLFVEGRKTDRDKPLINRYGPRRSLIWALANEVRLYPLGVIITLVGLFGILNG